MFIIIKKNVLLISSFIAYEYLKIDVTEMFPELLLCHFNII